MVRVGQARHVDVGELEHGGELLEGGHVLHVQLLDVDQPVRRQAPDAALGQVPATGCKGVCV